MEDDLNLTETPTPEQIAQDFKAMDDSCWVIDNKIENGPYEFQTQEEANAEVDRNVRHLELMLSKDYIKEDGHELATYQVAITDGTAYIAEHPVVEGGAKE